MAGAWLARDAYSAVSPLRAAKSQGAVSADHPNMDKDENHIEYESHEQLESNESYLTIKHINILPTSYDQLKTCILVSRDVLVDYFLIWASKFEGSVFS